MITLKWRRDNGREEILASVTRTAEIEVYVNRDNEITQAQYRQPGGRHGRSWNSLNRRQPIWKDLEKAVANFVAEREVVLAEVTADAAKEAQL